MHKEKFEKCVHTHTHTEKRDEARQRKKERERKKERKRERVEEPFRTGREQLQDHILADH